MQQLLINNNAIENLQQVALRDLPSLTYLSLDRNNIVHIGPDDFNGLGQSIRLMSLSLAENQIEDIDGRAFEPVHQIIALSLQNNLITSLKSKQGLRIKASILLIFCNFYRRYIFSTSPQETQKLVFNWKFY